MHQSENTLASYWSIYSHKVKLPVPWPSHTSVVPRLPCTSELAGGLVKIQTGGSYPPNSSGPRICISNKYLDDSDAGWGNYIWESWVCRCISFLYLCNKLLNCDSSLKHPVSSRSYWSEIGDGMAEFSMFSPKSRCWMATFSSGAQGPFPSSFLLLAGIIPVKR